MEIVVEKSAIDELGHVNNATFFVFVETIARGHADAIGLTSQAMRGLGGAFVVRSHEATYFGQAVEGDKLRLATSLEINSGAACFRTVEIFIEDRKIFQCRTTWVWIDRERRTPKRLPSEIAEGFRKGRLSATLAS